MRRVNEQIFLDEMPSGTGELASWLAEVREAEIERVVCLVPEDEIAAVAPEYAEWRAKRLKPDRRSGAVYTGEPRLRVLNLPLPRAAAPGEDEAHAFWEAAFAIAGSVLEDARVLIHGTTGVGRTGMFAAAVLIALGHSEHEAARAVAEAGSPIETDRLGEFLQRGIPGPVLDPMPAGDEGKAGGAFAARADERADEGVDKRAAERDLEPGVEPAVEAGFEQGVEPGSRRASEQATRLITGPNNRNRRHLEALKAARAAHPVLEAYGLRTLLDPCSRRWSMSGGREKLEALSAVVERKRKDSPGLPRAICEQRLSIGIVLDLLQPFQNAVECGFERIVFAGITLLQASVDAGLGHGVPVSEHSCSEAFAEFRRLQVRLKDRRHRNALRRRAEAAGLGPQPLGRYELDSASSEGKKLTLAEKCLRIRAVAQSDLSLTEAVVLYISHYGSAGRAGGGLSGGPASGGAGRSGGGPAAPRGQGLDMLAADLLVLAGVAYSSAWVGIEPDG